MSEYICVYYDLDVKSSEKVHEGELRVYKILEGDSWIEPWVF